MTATPETHWNLSLQKYHRELYRWKSPPEEFVRAYQLLTSQGPSGCEQLMENLPELMAQLVSPYQGKTQAQIEATRAFSALQPCYYIVCLLDLVFQQAVYQVQHDSESDSDTEIDESARLGLLGLTTMRSCLEAWLDAGPNLTLAETQATGLYTRYTQATDQVSSWVSGVQQHTAQLRASMTSIHQNLANFAETIKPVTQIQDNDDLLCRIYRDLPQIIKTLREDLSAKRTDQALAGVSRLTEFQHQATQAETQTQQLLSQIPLPEPCPSRAELTTFQNLTVDERYQWGEEHPGMVEQYLATAHHQNLSRHQQRLAEVVETITSIVGKPAKN